MANLDLKIQTHQADNPASHYPGAGFLKRRALRSGNPTSRYPSAGLAQAEADFQRRYPQYEHTTKLDELRATVRASTSCATSMPTPTNTWRSSLRTRPARSS